MLPANLFLLDGSVVRHPAVEAWLAETSGERGELARAWFGRLRACGSDVREVMHDGTPTVCVRGAAFAYVGVYAQHVNVGFFHGAALPDPEGLLQGTGKRMRHVKVRPDVPVDAAALQALISVAYDDIVARTSGVRTMTGSDQRER